MNTKINTTNGSRVDASYETSKFALGVGLSMAALVGLWGVASLVSALTSYGPVGLAKSLFSAITGI